MHVPWVQQSHWKARMTKEGTSVLLALFVSLLCQTRVLDINSVNKMVGSHLELAAIMKVIEMVSQHDELLNYSASICR